MKYTHDELDSARIVIEYLLRGQRLMGLDYFAQVERAKEFGDEEYAEKMAEIYAEALKVGLEAINELMDKKANQ